MVEFASGKLPAAQARERMLACTNEQLALLMNDPQFHAWQRQKAARENRARAVTNVLAVAGCCLLVLAMALLKPAAVGGLGDQVASLSAPKAPLLRAEQAAGPEPLAADPKPVEGVSLAPLTNAEMAALEAAEPTSPLLDEDDAGTEPPSGTLRTDDVYRVLETFQRRLAAAEEEKAGAWEAVSNLSQQLERVQEEREEQAELVAQLTAQRLEAWQAAQDKERHVARLVEMVQEQSAAYRAAKAAAARVEAEKEQQAAALLDQLTEHAQRAATLAVQLDEQEQQATQLAEQLAEKEQEAAAAAARAAAAAAVVAAVTAADAPAEPTTCPIQPAFAAPEKPTTTLPPGLASPHANATIVLPDLAVHTQPPPPPLRIASTAASTVPTTATGTTDVPASALYALLAAVACASLALVVYLRDRRAIASETARALQLSARLKEASFAKDTAEQSLALLESELQLRMKQLEEAQQRAAAAATAASPRIGTISPTNRLTPGKGELPPPPASLIEKFLRDHNFLAVQEEQMREWLEMEQQFGEMQSALAELQSTLAEKDAQIAAYEQDFNAINEHSTLELRTREEQLSQVRAWLDEAQDELMSTQAALQEQELECRRVTAQLESLRAAALASPGSLAEREGELMQQNLDLVRQLQSVTSAYEDMQAQLASSSATDAAQRALQALGSRPPSAADSVPGTPGDLTREVQSCLEMMRATRAQLADRLAHSQATCEAMIADCSQAGANKGGQLAAATVAGAAEQAGPAAVAEEHAASAAVAFGSPTVGSPAFSEEQQQQQQAVQQVEPEWTITAVLGDNTRRHTNVLFDASPVASPVKKQSTSRSPSPSKRATPPSSFGQMPANGENSPAGMGNMGADSSMRQAWEAAHARVAAVRGQHNSWDVVGFVRQLGFEIDAASPADRGEFTAAKDRAETALRAAAANAATPYERALAGEAMQARAKVLHNWEWPVHPINTPPPSPFWRMLGLQG